MERPERIRFYTKSTIQLTKKILNTVDFYNLHYLLLVLRLFDSTIPSLSNNTNNLILITPGSPILPNVFTK